MKAVGHTGTLDPFATGLLVLLTGRATRLARFVEQQAKTYLATARLGFATTTDDATGEPVGDLAEAGGVTEQEIAATLAGFVGPQQQTPPAYSAKKVGGERSYRKARRGEAVALAPVEVTVHELGLIALDRPLVTFRITVSAGTYIRALARDLGDRLGTGGHLTALRREAIGQLRVEDAIPLAGLNPATPLVPLRSILRQLPSTELDEAERFGVGHGRPVERGESAEAFVVLTHQGDVVAVARQDGGWLRPVVVLDGP